MKKVVLLVVLIPIGIYLVLPSPSFPLPPPGSLQSTEPGDTESVYRRSYYTNMLRQEIMTYYDKSFPGLLQYRLNLPPEDAYSVIRDQTRSSYLEAIVHPWREHLYINVFVPVDPTQQINIDGVHYLNKITVRYIPSHPISRLTALSLTIIFLRFLTRQWHT